MDKEGVVLFYPVQNMSKDRKWLGRKAWWERHTPKSLILILFSCIKGLHWPRSERQNVKARPLMSCSEGTRLPGFSLEEHHQNLHMPQALASRQWASVSTEGVKMNSPVTCSLVLAKNKEGCFSNHVTVSSQQGGWPSSEAGHYLAIF